MCQGKLGLYSLGDRLEGFKQGGEVIDQGLGGKKLQDRKAVAFSSKGCGKTLVSHKVPPAPAPLPAPEART